MQEIVIHFKPSHGVYPYGGFCALWPNKITGYIEGKIKIKTQLEEFNEKIGDLKEKAKRMVGKTKSEALEEIKRLEKKSEEEIKLKMHKLAETSEDVWQTTKVGIDNSLKDLRGALKKTMSRHSKVRK
jgi:F0F1-type ATP synthase membrane subunit b/b'